jgi:hypothetical protein
VLKAPGLTRRGVPIRRSLRQGEGSGIPGVVVKCVEIRRNARDEGGYLALT